MKLGKFIIAPGCDFAIGETQVTQKQWQSILGNSPSYFKGESLPVETVSFDDCKKFITALNTKSKKYTYRLPTDEEWLKCFGKDIASSEKVLESAWCYENSSSKTHEVKTKAPNEFGLYDMRGNVWEWTSTLSGSYRVFRGGSWDCHAQFLRSAQRDYGTPDDRNRLLGFRLVRTPRIPLPSYAVTLSNSSESRAAEDEAALISDLEAIQSKVEAILKRLK